MHTKILIKRGKNRDCDYIPYCGEPVYIIEEKALMIGDGKTSVKDLVPSCILNNVVKDKSGKLYNVTIEEDENGGLKHVDATPIFIKNKCRIMNLYAMDDTNL